MSLEAWGDDGDIDEGRGFTEDRMDDAFRDGLQAMREMLARFVEQGGDSTTAESIRANWNPDWGVDPGKPDAVASTWDSCI
jgi:hypothetical protein